MKDRVLWMLLALAFFLRIAGILYGLPLMVVGDEPPFVLGALQMLQLHTVIPALYPEEFQAILYYPPYISYLYLVPFAATIGVKWLLWHGTGALFSSYLLSNLSVFFEIGRAIMITLGVVSVYLVYKIAETIYQSKVAARIAAFLLATSILHIALSSVGRHWIPVSFLFLLTLFILTREHLPALKRLIFSLLVVGLGMGVSTASSLVLIPIGCWFFFLSGLSPGKVIRDKWLWGAVAMCAFLAAVPSLLYQGSQEAFLGGFSLFEHKNIFELLLSPFHALLLTAYSEPVLIALFLSGLVSLWFVHRRWGLFAAAFFVLYIFAFYILFDFQPRFMLPIIPLYSLVAPALYMHLRRYRFAPLLFMMLLLVPMGGALRVSYLMAQGDTRSAARAWMLEHRAPGDKILVYGNLLRLSSDARGTAALREIDSGAVRKTDVADEALNNPNVPLVLNLSNVKDDAFFAALPDYARKNGYTYAVVQERYGEKSRTDAFEALESGAIEVARFEGLGETSSIAESAFTDPLLYLFSGKQFGPTVSVYRLR